MRLPIVTVYTNDNNLWLLEGFQYLFRKYWSSTEKVRVVGYSAPKYGMLADNFSFISISRRNYPASEWSTGVIQSIDKFLANGEEFMIMMLEDFWLKSPVNHNVISYLLEFLHEQPRDILRIDLTADRCQHRSHISGEMTLGDFTIIETKPQTPYQMSFQAGIWNLKLMREILNPYEDPWRSEIEGSKRLAISEKSYRVLGTRNHPVQYQPVYRSKRASLDISRLPVDDQDVIVRRGWV